MKKAIWIILVLYFATAIVLVATAEAPAESVTILSVPQEYSRLISRPEETLGVLLFYDQEGTFLTEISNIRSARIFGEDGELAVSIETIEELGEKVEFQSGLYFSYRFDVGFAAIAESDLSISFREATLEIIYENGRTFSFLLGNLNLTFNDLEGVSHLGLTRLYGIINPIDGEDSLAGFVIGLEKMVTSEVSMTDVSIACGAVFADFGNMTPLAEAVDRRTPVSTLLGIPDFPTLADRRPEGSLPILLEAESLYFIPIIYVGKLTSLARFPIIISYRYNGNSYQFYLDDFLFCSSVLVPEVLIDDVVKTEYRY
jgi:hypothetical protein